jgi:hypothetical protein
MARRARECSAEVVRVTGNFFLSYSPQKSQKNFTRSDLQPSLGLLHNLVSKSVVLSSCLKLSLVAGLDLF